MKLGIGAAASSIVRITGLRREKCPTKKALHRKMVLPGSRSDGSFLKPFIWLQRIVLRTFFEAAIQPYPAGKFTQCVANAALRGH